PIVCAAIMPHGDALLPFVQPDPLELHAVRSVLEEIGRSVRAARPDAVLLLSPHHIRIRGQIAVTSSAFVEGTMTGPGGEFHCRLPVARNLSEKVASAARTAGLRAAEVNYATADGDLSCLPLDWGSLIPLFFLTDGGAVPCPVTVVGPPRDLGLHPLVTFGREILKATEHMRIALIASADLGHAHLVDGPYGYHMSADRYDRLVQHAVGSGDLTPFADTDPDLIENAKADAPWQLAILHGALQTPAHTISWAYARPTYFGMLAALFAAD
ncbi:Extradiol ring-cleavage dioxygenase, class III enzyme, subunit B, partial [mine drainage metagenome]